MDNEQRLEQENHNKEPPRGIGYLTFSIIRKVLIYLFTLSIVTASLLFAIDKNPQKSFFGFRYYIVISPSMSPTYEVGDLVFVKIKSADNINVNDVITFNPSSDSEAYLTHRVTEKFPDYQNTGVTCFKTKGDANDTEDSFLIDESRVIGTVQLHVPRLGYIIRFVQLRWYYVLPLLIMLWISFQLMKKYFSLNDDYEEPKINNEKE